MHDLTKNEVLAQLFTDGPTWDGDLIAKSDRNELVRLNLVDCWEGWNFLTEKGVQTAVQVGMTTRHHVDQRWYKKATNQ